MTGFVFLLLPVVAPVFASGYIETSQGRMLRVGPRDMLSGVEGSLNFICVPCLACCNILNRNVLYKVLWLNHPINRL